MLKHAKCSNKFIEH